MSWYSLLPSHLTTIETWIVRFFILLGLLTIGPWAFLILYDLLLYIWRAATYEIPWIGGRARGRQRPRAPSLVERPSGRPRTFSLAGGGRRSVSGSGSSRRSLSGGKSGGDEGDVGGLRRRKRGVDGGFGKVFVAE